MSTSGVAQRCHPRPARPGPADLDHFEQAAELVTEDDAAASTPCGPDIEPILKSVHKYVDAGYDHLYFHQIGPDQDGFFRFWTDRLQPALTDLTNRIPD